MKFLLYSDSCTIKTLKQYLHLSNLNEKIQVSGNLKFLDQIDEAILATLDFRGEDIDKWENQKYLK